MIQVFHSDYLGKINMEKHFLHNNNNKNRPNQIAGDLTEYISSRWCDLRSLPANCMMYHYIENLTDVCTENRDRKSVKLNRFAQNLKVHSYELIQDREVFKRWIYNLD